MLTYDQIRAAGRQARFERFLAGLPLPRKIRRRSRSPEKLALLRIMAADKLAKYPPRYEERDGEKFLILPYFFMPELKAP